MEARKQIKHNSERGARWQQYLEKRGVLEMEESKRRKLLEAGHRRLTNEISKTQDLIITTTDIEETRQYLVPLTMDQPMTASSRRATQFSSKRRRKRPSDGRERSPKRKRRSTPEHALENNAETQHDQYSRITNNSIFIGSPGTGGTRNPQVSTPH